ncbi:hypothetical protein [Streptomyces sp. MUM 16J]|uniref:hypothetical protein n=1 Tax=Streptomyces sp. MUM 16J TaxID=2791988 RepID=UPI001F04AB43|nr:hypothetical protein [Streptomyces sp. MUM 16J]MCH0559335.1 hypothetical protein [Streptomyces sp. MUM 16J]
MAEPYLLAHGRWTADGDGPPSAVAGFTGSPFSPSIAVAAERCLRQHLRGPLADDGPVVAVVLVSVTGDLDTDRVVAEALDTGRRVPPLLFFQSNPNAVLGHIAARWKLRGPVISLGAGHGAPSATAAALLDDGEAELVLLLTAEPGVSTASLYTHAHPENGTAFS